MVQNNKLTFHLNQTEQMQTKFHLAIVCLLLTVTPCLAQEDKIDTDRPDQTESPFVIPKKWFQFEMGFNRQQNNKSSKEFFLPTLLSKFGIAKRFELRLITTVISTSDTPSLHQTGLEPVEIGGKLALVEEKNFIPKISLLFHVAIPKLASKNFQANHLAPNFRFSIQHSLAKNIGLGYNIGAEWDGISKEPAWIYTLAPGFNIGEKWYAYVELFGSVSKQESAQHNADGGVAWYPGHNSKIDLSGGFGLSGNSPDWYMALGYSFRFRAGK